MQDFIINDINEGGALRPESFPPELARFLESLAHLPWGPPHLKSCSSVCVFVFPYQSCLGHIPVETSTVLFWATQVCGRTQGQNQEVKPLVVALNLQVWGLLKYWNQPQRPQKAVVGAAGKGRI